METPVTMEERAVRILLECILVLQKVHETLKGGCVLITYFSVHCLLLSFLFPDKTSDRHHHVFVKVENVHHHLDAADHYRNERY